MNDGARNEAEHDAAEFRRELFEERNEPLTQAVSEMAEREELKARLTYVRGQRDALLAAASATRLFHSIGGLITREQVEKWRAITGDSDFSAQGLFNFVVQQMAKAGVES